MKDNDRKLMKMKEIYDTRSYVMLHYEFKYQPYAIIFVYAVFGLYIRYKLFKL